MPDSLLQSINKLLVALHKLITSYMPPSPPPDDYWQELSDRLYEISYESIGTDVSPDDLAEDRLGCVESLSQIIRTAFPDLHFPIKLSTRELGLYLERSLDFKKIYTPEKGCIMLAITGTGNGMVAHGHVAIVGRGTAPNGTLWAMSNNSTTGKWEANYSVGSFTSYFKGKGGMPITFYRRM